jgi:spore germination protein KB
MFARLHALFPNKNIFDIMEICFGKIVGKIFIVIFIWYAFHSLALLFEDIGFFIRTVMIMETPCIVTTSVFAVISAYITKQGIEVFGRWAEIFLIVPIVLEIIILLLLIPKLDPGNLLPVAYEGVKPILEGAFLSFGFPFMYVIGFTMIFSFSAEKNSPYKIYLTGLFVGAVLLIIIYIIVILVLGDDLAEGFYYPSYVMVSRISIGNFLQRFDIIAAVIYLIGIYVQGNVFLLATCNGVAKLFNCDDYRFIVLPIAFLAVNLSILEMESIMAFFDFAINVWPYYVIPFEIIIPVITWIAAEIKSKKIGKNPSRNSKGLVEQAK